MGRLFNAAGFEGQTERALQGGPIHWVGGRGGALSAVALGWKEESLMFMGEPLLAQEFESPFRQGNVAVAIAFASADVQEHAFGVDVGDLQIQTFPQAQAAGIDQG